MMSLFHHHLHAFATQANQQPVRLRIANAILALAYRLVSHIDSRAVPRRTNWAFTFEERRGVVFNDTALSSASRGCPLYYLSATDYDRAFSDSATMSSPRGGGL